MLIRPSGTEPLVRVMIEGEDQKYLEKKAQIAIFTPLHGCIDIEKYGIKVGEERGIKIGMKIGMSKGVIEGRKLEQIESQKRIAKRMKELKIDTMLISSSTGLSISQIKKL